MNQNPEARECPSLPPLVWVVQILVFIACVALNNSVDGVEGPASQTAKWFRLIVLLLGIAAISGSSRTTSLCVFTSIVFFEPILTLGSVYLITFYIVAGCILWFRAGLPRFDALSVMLLIISVSLAFTFMRELEGATGYQLPTSYQILLLSCYYGCAAMMSAIAASRSDVGIDWTLVAMSIGITSSLTLLASLVWVVLYSEVPLTEVIVSWRLGPMSLSSSNSAAAGWSTGAMAWGVYAARGGRRWLATGGGVLCLVGVWMSRTWAASIILLICLPIVLARCVRGWQMLLGLWGFALAFFAGLSFMSGVVGEQYGFEGKDVASFSGRLDTWRTAIQTLADNPSGVTLAEWNRLGITLSLGNVAYTLTPHNGALQVGVFGGIAGIVGYVGVMLSVMGQTIVEGRKYRSWAFLGVYTILALVTIDVWYFYPVLTIALHRAPGADVKRM